MQNISWESASIITIEASSLCVIMRKKSLVMKMMRKLFLMIQNQLMVQEATPDGDENLLQLAPNFFSFFHLSMNKLNNKFTSGGSFFIFATIMIVWKRAFIIIAPSSQLSN